MAQHIIKNGWRMYVHSPEEKLRKLQEQEARRQQRHREEQYAVSLALLEELRGIRERLESQSANNPDKKPETLPRRKQNEYGEMLVCLVKHLDSEKNCDAMQFLERLNSPASMMELLLEHGFVSAEEAKDRTKQRTLSNHMQKFDGGRGAILIEGQDRLRVDIGALEDMAAGNGMTCAKNKGEKPHDYTGKFNQRKKA